MPRTLNLFALKWLRVDIGTIAYLRNSCLNAEHVPTNPITDLNVGNMHQGNWY